MSIAQRATSTVLSRLREETREVHEQLERELNLVSPDLSKQSYLAILKRFYSFYSRFEPEVWPRLPPVWSALFAQRRKLPALQDDLAALGVQVKTIKACPHLVRYANLPQIWGALYVTEGSTLGGQIISRHVGRQLGLTADSGLRFFSSYGAEVGSRWKQFTQLLVEEASSEDAGDVVKGAQETFEAISKCLSLSNTDD